MNLSNEFLKLYISLSTRIELIEVKIRRIAIDRLLKSFKLRLDGFNIFLVFMIK